MITLYNTSEALQIRHTKINNFNLERYMVNFLKQVTLMNIKGLKTIVWFYMAKVKSKLFVTKIEEIYAFLPEANWLIKQNVYI